MRPWPAGGRVATAAALALVVACGGEAPAPTAEPQAEAEEAAATERGTPDPEPGPTGGARLDAGRSLQGSVSGLSGAASDLNARVTETEIVVDLPADVLFDFDEAELRPEAVPTLQKVAQLIRENPAGLVSINGHTDAVGSDEYNRSLSERRARSVAEWLQASGGIDAARLRTAGFGKTRPIAPNQRPDGADDPEGRQRNRRVEVILPRQ